MKNFTRLALYALLFTAVRLVAQPTAAPTAPTQAAADVVSILSNAYTPLANNFTPAMPAVGINFFPDWGQGTTFAEFPIAGNPIKRYNALDYQGIDFGGNINASSMTTLHWDVWTDVATTLRISLIANGGGERFVTRTTAVGWNSLDIPLTEYTSQSGFSVSNIFQFKFEENPMAYRAGTKTVYLYNLYFWKPANVPALTGFTVPAKLVGDAPFALTAPTSPSSGAFSYTSSDPLVATVSGNMVTVVGVGTTTITANQAAAGAYSAGTTSAVLTVSSPGPAAAAPTPTRASTGIISLYSNAYTDLTGTIWNRYNGGTGYAEVMIAGNTTQKYTNLSYSVSEPAAIINATTKTHLHVDVWTATAGTNFKIKLVDFGPNGVYQGSPNDDTEHEITVSPNPGGGAWASYDIPLSDFTGLAARASLAQFIISSATAGQTFWLDNIYFYTATVAPTEPTVAATTPTRPQANVISLFSNAYTDLAGTNWNPGWGQTTVYSEVMVAGNATKKYAALNYQGAEPASPINATSATHLHVDFWAASATNFRIKLVDFGANGVYNAPGTGDDTEHEIDLGAQAGGAWVALDIPLANFTGLAARAHLAQFIISTTSASPTIWLDNIYFYSNTVIPVELVNFKAKTSQNATVLTWKTASERNNQGFTIERSNDGNAYSAIGQVKGNGTTNVANDYTFTDNTPSVGTNYYRLRQTDNDGKETVSSVVAVVFGKSGLVIRNTVANNLVDITVGEASPVTVGIFNVSGQQVYAAKMQGTQSLDVSAWASGLYIVRTSTGDVSRFVKQ